MFQITLHSVQFVMRFSFSVLLLLVLLSFCGGQEEPEAKVLLFKVGGLLTSLC